jgi:hypothetical protein
MSPRAIVAAVMASVLLAGLVSADAARAGRLDDAGRALREPGVWVDPDLTWLVGPREVRRLDRQIDRADVPVRIAVLPQVEVDESRGDQRAIARAIMRRADRDGLYVLVDQDGRLAAAARDVPLDLGEASFSPFSELGRRPLSEQLAAIVPTVRAAAPATPTSFEPFANPKGLPSSGGGRDGDPLAGIALACALLGAIAGFGLHFMLRAAVAGADAWRSRGHG